MNEPGADLDKNPRLAPSLSQAVAAFATSHVSRPFPQSARHILRLSLLDWFAVAHAARDEPVSRIVRDMAAREAGAPRAHIIGLAAALPARAAALVNGTTSHALDYDDTHFLHIGHPSVAVLPAALAVGEMTGARGPAFLDAALIGIEVACRIGDWLGRRHYDHGFHQTATSGCFGAAMACARLLGLDAGRASHALGIAATRASGLKSQFGTMGKPYNAGIAAANGVEAAMLAQSGFVSRPDGLECAQGFADTHAGEKRGIDEVLDGLGERFVFETVLHKFHACCHGLHASLEALAEARERHRVAPSDIASVTITTHPSWLKVCNIAEPATGLEAKFSYRLTAAMVLAGRDTAALASFTEAACSDAELLALRERVRVAADDNLADTAATVRIGLNSGEIIEARHDLERPMPPAEREAKVRDKAAVLLGRGRANAIWQMIATLEAPEAEVDWPMLFAGPS